jgi:lipopolysaccharide export LptBFGC system permease protein LptF
MKQERELLAIISSGVAPLRLIIPFIAFSIFTFSVAYMVTGYVGPTSIRNYHTRLVEMARQSFMNDLKPGALFDGIQGTLLLVGGFDRDSGRIDGLILIRSDLDETETGEIIIAEKGQIQSPTAKTNALTVKMENGTFHPVASAGSEYRLGSFDSLTLKVENQAPKGGLRVKEYLMGASNKELRSWSPETDDKANRRLAAMYTVEVNRRLVFPLTILLYPFIIFPATVTTGKHGKIAAFSGSIFLFIMNFLLFSLGSRLAYQGIVPAALGAWFPAIFLLLAGLTVFPIYTVSQLRGLGANVRGNP